MGKIKVAVVMGSKSDWEVMKAAVETLQAFGVEAVYKVVSAHRMPDQMFRFAEMAEFDGLEIIIAGAGGAAHLPGMIAAKTCLPVIGVPVKSRALSGQDSLLSIVQMPAGVPVACMAIDGSKNAALYALRILAIQDEGIRDKLKEFMIRQEKEAEASILEIDPKS